MPVIRLRPKSLCGLSFSIADLILLKSWAEAQCLRMTVQLDHGIEGEEYEEVVGLSKTERTLCQWILWRDNEAVFLQPLIGRAQRYRCVADAIEALTPKQTGNLTNIQATYWPRS